MPYQPHPQGHSSIQMVPTSARLTPDSITLDLRPPRRASACAVALERCEACRGWYSLAYVLFPATHVGALLTRGVRSWSAKKKPLTAAPVDPSVEAAHE